MIVKSIEELAAECASVRDHAPPSNLHHQRRIAIYGAGFLGKWAIQWLRGLGIEPVACFDGDPSRLGTDLRGVKVEPPSEISSVQPDFTFITARHAAGAVRQVLDEAGAPSCSLDAYLAASHFDRFRDIHDGRLSDDLSRHTLRAVLATMLSGNTTYLHPVFQKDQYFCLPQFSGATAEIYIDAGAYVGDSLERFIWATGGAFSRIHAFEPGEKQFAALQYRTQRLLSEWALGDSAITLNQLGLTDRTGFVSATTTSGQLQSLSLTSVDDGVISTNTLDNYLDGQEATFIKAEEEGMELALLRGAARTITRWKPKLAICVYHYPLDLLDIVAYVSALLPEYCFALRHHSPRQLETVLYCWAPEKQRTAHGSR